MALLTGRTMFWMAIMIMLSIDYGYAAMVSPAGLVTAHASLKSRGTEDSRQARISVTNRQNGDGTKRPVRVTFSGYFNVTATVWLPANETEALHGDGVTKPWSVTTALNFTALQGPIAVSFGAAHANAAANLTTTQPSQAQSGALGGSVRLTNKALVGFGAVSGSAQGGASTRAAGAAGTEQNSDRMARGAGGATVEVRAGRGGAQARGMGAGIGEGSLNGTARSTAVADGMGAAAGVGTSGDAYQGKSESYGGRRLTTDRRVLDTHAFGFGSGTGSGGGSGSAAGSGAKSFAQHESVQ